MQVSIINNNYLMSEQDQKEIETRLNSYKEELVALNKRFNADVAGFPVFLSKDDGTFSISVRLTIINTLKEAVTPEPVVEEVKAEPVEPTE